MGSTSRAKCRGDLVARTERSEIRVRLSRMSLRSIRATVLGPPPVLPCYSTRDQAYDADDQDTNWSSCGCAPDAGAAGCGAGILRPAEERDRTHHQGLPRESPGGPPG